MPVSIKKKKSLSYKYCITCIFTEPNTLVINQDFGVNGVKMHSWQLVVYFRSVI